VMKEVTAAAGVGFTIGLSIHLLKDAFIDQEQSVRFKFPFLGGPGTIIPGTYLDDDIWLGTNGLYAAKLAKDILIMGFGEDVNEVIAAFKAWSDQTDAVDAVNNARKQSMEESRRLSQELDRQIPTDGAPTEFPKWIRG